MRGAGLVWGRLSRHTSRSGTLQGPQLGMQLQLLLCLPVQECLKVQGQTAAGTMRPAGWRGGRLINPALQTLSRLSEREPGVCQGCGVCRRHLGGAADLCYRENGGQGGEQEVCCGGRGGCWSGRRGPLGGKQAALHAAAIWRSAEREPGLQGCCMLVPGLKLGMPTHPIPAHIRRRRLLACLSGR